MTKRKAEKFKVWQDESGKWCCSTPEIPNGWATGDTADQAIERQKVALADFRQMVRHHRGTCEEGCRWCKDHPDTKGIFREKTDDEA